MHSAVDIVILKVHLYLEKKLHLSLSIRQNSRTCALRAQSSRHPSGRFTDPSGRFWLRGGIEFGVAFNLKFPGHFKTLFHYARSETVARNYLQSMYRVTQVKPDFLKNLEQKALQSPRILLKTLRQLTLIVISTMLTG